jgi:hypothetical protein
MLALLDQLDEPLLVGLRLRRTIISPDVTRWTEAGLEILQQAGLSPGQVFRPLFLYTFGHAAFAPREDIAGRCPKGARTAVLNLSPDAYPLVTAAARELR